jgi:uncharacterized DUF497 family protein
MAITFDPVKRALALQERQLDFADAEKVFVSDDIATFEDDRFDYRETRYITAGRLGGRMVMIVWTPRGADRHVISMRHCHAKEERKLVRRFGLRGS